MAARGSIGQQMQLFQPSGRATYTSHGLPTTEFESSHDPEKWSRSPDPPPPNVGQHRRMPHKEQLKMFMSANEISKRWGPLDLDRQSSWTDDRPLYGDEVGTESDEELWERKAEEAEDFGLTKSIREGGVKSPVSLGFSRNIMGQREILGGHHRMAVMREEAPGELMPVTHYPSFHEAKSDPRYT